LPSAGTWVRLDWKEPETGLKNAAEREIAIPALIAHINKSGEPKLRNLEPVFSRQGITVGRTADDLVRYGKMTIIDRRTLFLLSLNFVHVDIDQSRGSGIVTRSAKINRPGSREAVRGGSEALCVHPRRAESLAR
jgi:hypothetical protein